MTADDKVPEDPDDDDDDPDDAAQDDDDNQPTPAPSPKPEHSLPAMAGPDHSPAGNIAAGTFMGEVPVRGHPYPQSSMMQSDLNTNSPGYVEGNPMSVSSQPAMAQTHSMSMSESYSDPHAGSRRPSLFTPPTEYGGSSSSGLYPNQGWQQSAPSTASPIYSFHHPQQQPHSAGGYVDQQQHVPLSQAPQYLDTQPFNGHSGHGILPSLSRPANIPQATLYPHQTLSFGSYHAAHGSAPLPRPHDENDHKRWNP